MAWRESLLDFPDLPVADATHRRHFGTQRVLPAQHLDLNFQSGREHGVETFGDALVQNAALGRQQAERQEGVGGRRPRPGGDQRRQRPAGNLEDFERALDALGIGVGQPGGRHRVDLRELGVQRRPAAGGGLPVDFGTGWRVGWRQVDEALDERLEIKHRAPDEQWDLAACRDRGHRCQCIGTEAGGRVGVRWIDQVDQVVREFGECCGVRLGRADVHVTKHLRRIDADQLDREASG